MKKTSKPAPKTSAKKALVAKQSAAKPKATAKPSTSTLMKKATKPANAPKLAPTRPTTNPLAAKSTATAKSSPKPNPREAQGQAELAGVVAQLAQSAEKLVQAANRLTEAANGLAATIRKPHTPEGQNDTFKTLSESLIERAASEEYTEVADVPATSPEQPAETIDGTKDE
jgi:hypothetical protein